MKTWDRGKKRSTPAQKEAAQKWQNKRVKIANYVARNPNINKICCICGNPGKILHNKKDPYYITFICDECRKDLNNLIIAEESRFDIREKVDKTHKCVQHFSNSQITRIIVGYMNNSNLLSIGDYCKSIGISRHQFNQVIQRYKALYPKQNIEKMISNRSNKIQAIKLKRIVEEKELK